MRFEKTECAGIVSSRISSQYSNRRSPASTISRETYPDVNVASRVLARSLFFLPAVRKLRRGQQMLAEVTADESAVSAAGGDRSALARAMLTFTEAPMAGAWAGVDPVRVDYLLGEPLDWRFPAVTCAAALALITLVVTVAILVGSEASGSATLAPPFLSAQPCVVMLALIPCAAGLAAIRVGRVARIPLS
jgi:hypothetical protein